MWVEGQREDVVICGGVGNKTSYGHQQKNRGRQAATGNTVEKHGPRLSGGSWMPGCGVCLRLCLKGCFLRTIGTKQKEKPEAERDMFGALF